MQEQNALIGVAVAAYFPDISLSGAAAMDRHASRCRSTSPTRCGRSAPPVRRCCSTAGCAARRSTPRAPSIGRASPIIGRPCSPPSSRWRISSSRCDLLTQQLGMQQKAVQGRSARRCDVYLNQFQAGTVAFTTVVTAEITAAVRRGSRPDHPAESVSRERQPDRSARRRLGYQPAADAKRPRKGHLVAAAVLGASPITCAAWLATS